MYNSRITFLRASLDSLAGIASVDLTPAVKGQMQEMSAELAGLLADRRERIAMRFHAQLLNALMPLVKLKKELEKIENGADRLAEWSIRHADELAAALDKANS